MTTPPTCPYCNEASKLVTGAELYPHRPTLHKCFFWRCEPCKAHVGCHREGALFMIGDKRAISNGRVPLGRLANADLRRAKSEAHTAFDTMWRTRTMSRNGAYRWLAKELGITVDECHIGMFDLQQCRAVVDAVAQYRSIP